MRELTKSEAKELAKESVEYTLSDLINPSDIDENAALWEDIDPDTLNEELWRSVEVMQSERHMPYHGIAYDLAICLWRDNLPRAPMGDLVFETQEKAVREGYWPNKMDKWQCREILESYSSDYEYFHEYLNEAWESVGAGIYEAMDPRDN